MKKLKEIDRRIIVELVKNSKASDRSLAKKLGVSQPTITRNRAKLEREGLLDYTAVPNLKTLGFQILAFSFSKWTSEALTEKVSDEEVARRVQKFLTDHPNVIFSATWGQGLGMNAVSISIHKDYACYDRWIKDVQREWGKYMDNFAQFIVNLTGDDVVRRITFKPFMEYFRKLCE